MSGGARWCGQGRAASGAGMRQWLPSTLACFRRLRMPAPPPELCGVHLRACVQPAKDALDTMVLGAVDLDGLDVYTMVDHAPFDPTIKRTESVSGAVAEGGWGGQEGQEGREGGKRSGGQVRGFHRQPAALGAVHERDSLAAEPLV